MRYVVDGKTVDTDDLLDLQIGPVPSWLEGEVDLVGVYADRDGRVYVAQTSRHINQATGLPVGTIFLRANRDVVQHLVDRFGLPRAYLDAAAGRQADV